MSERLNLASSGGKDQEDDEYECQVCNANLFVSLVGILMMRMMRMKMMMMAMRRVKTLFSPDDENIDDEDDDGDEYRGIQNASSFMSLQLSPDERMRTLLTRMRRVMNITISRMQLSPDDEDDDEDEEGYEYHNASSFMSLQLSFIVLFVAQQHKIRGGRL